MSLCKGFTQGGSNADNVLADAYVKGITDGIDWDAGYAAVQKDADEEPFDWSNEGRGGMESWKKLNYIPVEDFDHIGFGTMTRSISRTLEYSYNDFAIAQMAYGMNKTADAERYESESRYWRNLFRKDQASYMNGIDTGFTGFFQPKYLNGTWGYQDPLKCSNIDNSGSICSLQNTAGETFESSIWEYQLYVSIMPNGHLLIALHQLRTSRHGRSHSPLRRTFQLRQTPRLPARPEDHLHRQ